MFQTEIRLNALFFFFNVPLQPAQVYRLLELVTVGSDGRAVRLCGTASALAENRPSPRTFLAFSIILTF